MKIMFYLLGKSEVRRSRDMHWLRIDDIILLRSFAGVIMRKDNISGLSSSLSTFNGKKQDNPQVSFQPVMCQHCNHACETVCPVAASHSRQERSKPYGV
jgi:molybdopterin-containing oxidoreductase family iron-sulfur binding subunit